MGRVKRSARAAKRSHHSEENQKSRHRRAKVCTPKPLAKCHLKVTQCKWDTGNYNKRIENITLRRLGEEKKVPMVAEQGDKKSLISKWHRIGIFRYSGEYLFKYPLWKATVKVYSAAKGLEHFVFASEYPPQPSDKSALHEWGDKRSLAYFLLRRSVENNEYDDFEDAGITALYDIDARDSILLYRQLSDYFEKTLAVEIAAGYAPVTGQEDEEESHRDGWDMVAKLLAFNGGDFPNLNKMVSYMDHLLLVERTNRIMNGKWQLPWNLIAGIFILELRPRDPDLASYLWKTFGDCDLDAKSLILRQIDDEFKNAQRSKTKKESRHLAPPSVKYGYLWEHEWSMAHVFYVMRKELTRRREGRHEVEANVRELQAKLDEMSISETELAAIDAQQKQNRERLAELTVEWDADEFEPENSPVSSWKRDADEEMKRT